MKTKDVNHIKSYREENAKNYRTRFAMIGFGLLLLLMIFLGIVGVQKAKGFFSSLSRSLFSFKVSAGEGIDTGSQLLKSKHALIADIQDLNDKLTTAQTQIAELAALKDENQKLTEILSHKKPGMNFLLARILSKPNSSIYDTLIVDQGASDGVVVGKRVFGRGDIPIGVVSEVDIHTAKIKLFTTSGEKTHAVIAGKDIFVDLVGDGGGTFETTLPRDIEIVPGTAVVLPEDNTTIALAEKSLADARNPFQRILFRSPVNLFELRYVQVEK